MTASANEDGRTLVLQLLFQVGSSMLRRVYVHGPQTWLHNGIPGDLLNIPRHYDLISLGHDQGSTGLCEYQTKSIPNLSGSLSGRVVGALAMDEVLFESSIFGPSWVHEVNLHDLKVFSSYKHSLASS